MEPKGSLPCSQGPAIGPYPSAKTVRVTKSKWMPLEDHVTRITKQEIYSILTGNPR
jgi:hypothetical protein